VKHKLQIRLFRPVDAQVLAQIFHEAARSTAPRFYRPQQVAAWSPAPVPDEQFLTRVSDGRHIFVAVDQRDAPWGFIELEHDGHIDCFYCHPSMTGIGVGSLLYTYLEAEAVAMGLTHLRVEASEAALAFFQHRGFTLIGRQDFMRLGVPIHNYAMVKCLSRHEVASQRTS